MGQLIKIISRPIKNFLQRQLKVKHKLILDFSLNKPKTCKSLRPLLPMHLALNIEKAYWRQLEYHNFPNLS